MCRAQPWPFGEGDRPAEQRLVGRGHLDHQTDSWQLYDGDHGRKGHTL